MICRRLTEFSVHRRDVGVCGVLNEIAHAEEEGESDKRAALAACCKGIR